MHDGLRDFGVLINSVFCICDIWDAAFSILMEVDILVETSKRVRDSNGEGHAPYVFGEINAS